MVNRDAMKDLPPASDLRKVKNSYEWINTWRYVIVQPSVKLVGFAAASFANKDGTSVRPGVRRLMGITGYSNRAVVDALTTLRWLGFLWRSKAGTRTPEGGDADEHWLCLPRDMSHIPIADFKTGVPPAFEELSPQARSVAEILGVVKRFPEQPSELSSGPSELTSLVEVTSVHHTNPFTNSNDHAAEQQAGARASSRAADDSFGAYIFIDESVGGLDPVEASTVNGMLADGRHPNAIINKIRSEREAA